MISIAGFLLVAFTQVFGRFSIVDLQQEPPNLQVPVIKQSWGTSRGEAVIAMTYNYAYPDTLITGREVISYAWKNGYYTPGAVPFTSPANMVKIADYYADRVVTGQVMNSRQGLLLLVERLRHREPVIIDVLSDFRDPASEAHFIVVTSVSVDPTREEAILVDYNDPLTGTKKKR